MSEELEPAAYRIGEPGYRDIVWGERDLKMKSAYDSLEEVKETADNIESFEFTELYAAEDIIQTIEEEIEELRTSHLRPVEVKVVKDRLENLKSSFKEDQR